MNKIVYKFKKRYVWNYVSTEEQIEVLTKDLETARADVKWLIDILVEADIIEDVPNAHQRVRTITKDDGWFTYETKQAFKVNSIKAKAKK